MYAVIVLNSGYNQKDCETIINCLKDLSEAKKLFNKEVDKLIENQELLNGTLNVSKELLLAEFNSDELCVVVSVKKIDLDEQIVVTF